MADDPQCCDVCGKPMIYDGETAFYAGVRHWDCMYLNGYKNTEEQFADVRQATQRCQDAITDLRRKLK